LEKTGFVDIRRGAEVRYGIDECAQYPLFTPELIALMRRLIPSSRHATVARSLIFTARKPRGR
jgi:arsenite methyltransferase